MLGPFSFVHSKCFHISIVNVIDFVLFGISSSLLLPKRLQQPCVQFVNSFHLILFVYFDFFVRLPSAGFQPAYVLWSPPGLLIGCFPDCECLFAVWLLLLIIDDGVLLCLINVK